MQFRGLNQGALLWLVAATIGMVLGWTARAVASECWTPRNEGGGYWYDLETAVLETDTGTVILDEEDPWVRQINSLTAYLPDTRGLPKDPRYTFYFDENITVSVE